MGQAVQPIINFLRDRLLEGPLIYGDETEIQVLKEPGRKAQTRSYMWAQMTERSGADGTGPPIPSTMLCRHGGRLLPTLREAQFTSSRVE